MSSFAPTGNASARAADPIINNGFWPTIDPAEFRDARRLDGTVTPPRVQDALLTAMATVNRVLRHWQAKQIDAGHQQAQDVPTPSWQPPGIYLALYRRAVYATAHAAIAEAYRDYDATASTRDRGDLQEYAGESYRRDASWAISEIMDRSHVTVELI
ncbi:head completion/stabilization protein [Kushneria phyllosphaerae]|uniref:Phage head completion protein (GPL) n=1 Tax=Kushneria phyllosphaerae TaxID=2100822 RepID=A0A2R8CQU2_9GAMM|nr:head completion/stabilization protein [Kushneria phyllosphaerae]SPJ35260.1 hypothetical protein KSP9073_03318 [Kushneria phyllosphaerae]